MTVVEVIYEVSDKIINDDSLL